MNVTGVLCGSAACSVLLFALPFASPQEPRSPEKVKEVKAKKSDQKMFHGRVEEVWASSLGHVQFLLRGAGSDGQEARLWFDTPPDKDVNTLFESLALDLIRHARAHEQQVWVVAESSSGDDGSSLEKAYDVVRLGINFGN